MATDIHHAKSSAKRYGGVPADYVAIHKWFDETKHHHGDFRHRALRHHTMGIAECVEKFGDTITNSEGSEVSVRWIAEQHVREDHGSLPSVTDWLKKIAPEPWMGNRARRLSRELAGDEKEDRREQGAVATGA